MNIQDRKIQDLINDYIVENHDYGNYMPFEDVEKFITPLVELRDKGKNITYTDLQVVLSTVHGNKLFVLDRLPDIFPISEKLYSEAVIEVYWEGPNILPIDFRKIFDPKRFDAKLGMSSADLRLFNTLSDMTVCKPLYWTANHNITWIKDPTAYCNCGQCYCNVLEAEVQKKNILFCRQGPFGIEVAVQWENIKVTKSFEVN